LSYDERFYIYKVKGTADWHLTKLCWTDCYHGH